MKTIYQITEYDSFITGRQVMGYVTLPAAAFEQLENFILSTPDALDVMELSFKKGLGKVITAKNYVGILTLKDGTSIEILPKLCTQTPYSVPQVKKLVLDMLKTLRYAPYKTLQVTNVDIENLDIFEIFIRMFLNEVFLLAKRGLKCSYETIASNETFFKGKLLFSEQIKYNCAHKERSFVSFDTFSSNRPENRLLKSTLLYLYRQTTSIRNKTDLRTLLTIFHEVPLSMDYASDFATCSSDRNMKDYTTALLWCRVFLTGKSFTSFSGSAFAFALLFPMETLFERYTAVQLKKVLDASVFQVSVQDQTHYLFTLPSKKFRLKPDIVIRRKRDSALFICDTKWKLLSPQKANYGISQADLYQMYVYQKKYNAKSITLLYPQTQVIPDEPLVFHSGDGVTVHVQFVDLFDIKNSLQKIAEEFSTE